MVNQDPSERSDFMRSLFIVLFLVWTSVQLALAGLPDAAVHTTAPTQGEIAAHAMSEMVVGVDQGHVHPTDVNPSLGCDSSASSCASCATCVSCSHCHGQQLAIADELLWLMAGAFAGDSFTWLTSRFVSAEAAPIFKPPIT